MKYFELRYDNRTLIETRGKLFHATSMHERLPFKILQKMKIQENSFLGNFQDYNAASAPSINTKNLLQRLDISVLTLFLKIFPM